MNCTVCGRPYTTMEPDRWVFCGSCEVFKNTQFKVPDRADPVSLPADKIIHGVRRFTRFAPYLFELHKRKPNARVYDALCGVGQFLCLVNFVGIQDVSGCDIKRDACDKAKEFYDVNVENSTFEDANLIGEYDLIFWHHGIEHSVDPRLCIQKSWKHLTVGGMLLLIHPTASELRMLDGGHSYEWTFEGFKRLIDHSIENYGAYKQQDCGTTQEHWLVKLK